MKITTKIAALTIIAAFAAAPAMAAHKVRHKKPAQTAIPENPQQMTPEQAMAYNKRNLSLVVQALPLVLPSWSLPIYFKMHEEQEQAKMKPKHHRRKHR